MTTPYIIIGAGDAGTPLIDIATESDNGVVVVDRDEERERRAADAVDRLVLRTAATTKETVDDAGTARTDASSRRPIVT